MYQRISLAAQLYCQHVAEQAGSACPTGSAEIPKMKRTLRAHVPNLVM